ncbi:MAG: TAXI family TRAP transporter solute-binding subunit [Burkholderiales bacterium]
MALSPRRFKRPKFERAAWREWLIIVLPIALLVIVAFALTSRFIKPAPPDSFVFSAGAEGGAYYRYALRYKEILARDGIKMQVQTSAGSLQNLSRMRGDAPEASAGFVQGGTTQPEDSNNLLSLGRMFYELVWVFHRLPANTDRLTQLQGKRVAVGPSGSGTNQLVMQLLTQSDVTANNATLLEIPAKAALDKLAAGELDAAFVVAGPEAEILQAPLRSKDIRLMSLAQSDAYAMRFSHLARIPLHQGVVDLKANIPARDVQMIGAGAIVAVRDDLHPALQFALAQAAAEVHKRPSIIHAENHFPQVQSSELPMSAVAERFHKTGPPFFQRYLPFWIAVLADRLLVLLIPIITILVPLIKIVPFLYTWRVRKRLWHWYDELKKLEQVMYDTPADQDKHLAEIDRIDEAVSDIPVPVEYSEQYYNLRSHVEFVRRRLDSQTTAAPTEG